MDGDTVSAILYLLPRRAFDEYITVLAAVYLLTSRATGERRILKRESTMTMRADGDQRRPFSCARRRKKIKFKREEM